MDLNSTLHTHSVIQQTLLSTYYIPDYAKGTNMNKTVLHVQKLKEL